MKQKPIYTVTCKKAWHGDAFGNEWKFGVSVYYVGETNPKYPYDVYEDDGLGNGSYLQCFSDELTACAWAKLYCQELDNKQ